MHQTRYLQPAAQWEEALPIGNGSLGGMVYGRLPLEQIDLNDDTLWSGYPNDQNPKRTKELYQTTTEQTLLGNAAEAQTLAEEQLSSGWTQSYLPMGSLFIRTPDAAYEAYQRSLDFTTATATVSYRSGGVHYQRNAYVSHPDQCMVVTLTSDTPAAITARFQLTSPLQSSCSIQENALLLQGLAPSYVEPSYCNTLAEPVIYEQEDAKKGMRFATRVKILATGGVLNAENNELCVTNADEVTLIITSQTSFAGADLHPYLHGLNETALCAAKEQTALVHQKTFYERHLADYQPKYRRTTLSLPENANSHLPTDLRLQAFLTDKTDCALYALLFHFGRYLTLTASREGSQATNLQGIWNSQVRPPWSSNYTININTEMNYWCTLPANLLECHEPMVRFVTSLREHGETTARETYGVDGFVAHHNSDLWQHTSPVGNRMKDSARFFFWNASAGWLCRSLAEQYDYTLDTQYLTTVYPTIRSAALFLKNILVEENGAYLCCPSTSPENAYLKDGVLCAVCKNATMSTAITQEIFQNVIRFSAILKQDTAFAQTLAAILPRLRNNGVGANGQLLEWDADYQESELDHRHVSHLYGLYPSDLITTQKTPALATACERSLLLRGDDGTGWSLGWKTCLWARLGKGDHALQLLKNQLRPVHTTAFAHNTGGGTYISLLDAHPPMQIDGNFAATAAMCELLLQNEKDGICVLPALPSDWHEGCAKGLAAKKRLTVDLSWTPRTCEVTLHTDFAQTTTVRLGAQCQEIALEKDRAQTLFFTRE